MRAARLRVLTYHRVLPRDVSCSPSTVSASPDVFEAQMRHLARAYRVVSSDEVVASLNGGAALPNRAVLITFDDGCVDFGAVAWPILRRYRLPATVFVPTAYPDHPERAFWWDRLHAAVSATRKTTIEDPACGVLALHAPELRRVSLRRIQAVAKRIPHAECLALVERLCRALGEETPPQGQLLGWDQLRELAADGATIGAHTHTHPALTQLPLEDARTELRTSRDELTRQLGRRPVVFAYPFGDYNGAVAELVREEGFAAAVTCVEGHNHVPGTDPVQLCRTAISRRTTARVFRFRLTAAGALVDRSRRLAARRAPAAPRLAPEPPVLKLAYIMSRFPKLSETFILNEALAMASLGASVELYPLLRERQAVQHPDVAPWLERARFQPFVSAAILKAHACFIARQPRAYASVLHEVLRQTWGSANFFIGALGIFPKAVRFAYEMRRDGVRHVHAHFATHPAVAALIVHRLTGIPFSFTAHGSDLHVERRMLAHKIESAAFAVTVSEFNKAVMLREAREQARHKIHVIHCGIDPQFFAPGPKAEHDRLVHLVCVASFEPVKGHRFLIEACRLLIDRGVALRCHLVGDGPERRDIETRIAASGLGAHVRLHGPQPRMEVARLLAASDIAVLASHPTRDGKREGIPVALMEAMAAGLPVVASRISGIPELVESGTNGLLVPSGDPAALADALQSLACDEHLRRRMGQASRERVVQSFDLRTNAQRLMDLIVAADAAEQPQRARVTATLAGQPC